MQDCKRNYFDWLHGFLKHFVIIENMKNEKLKADTFKNYFADIKKTLKASKF